MLALISGLSTVQKAVGVVAIILSLVGLYGINNYMVKKKAIVNHDLKAEVATGKAVLKREIQNAKNADNINSLSDDDRIKRLYAISREGDLSDGVATHNSEQDFDSLYGQDFWRSDTAKQLKQILPSERLFKYTEEQLRDCVPAEACKEEGVNE